MNEERKMTLDEAAEVAGVARRTIERAVHQGDIQVHRVVRGTFVSEADLRAWLTRRDSQNRPAVFS